MEIENKGGGRAQGLEKALMEARVTNARLMEENESFQTLLMEKTLSGDYPGKGMGGDGRERAPSASSAGAAGASLADELASVAEDDETQPQESRDDRLRRLEVEVERQKAENKALTLYINKIIERILKHQGGFETILSTNDDESDSESASPKRSHTDKALPPPPTDDGDEPQGMLQRVKSMAIAATSSKPKARPQSVIGPMRTGPSLTEDPDTAPRIPLGRNTSHRHSMALPRRANTSNDAHSPGAAAIVGNMFRGDSDGSGNTHTTSPGINSPRASYFFNRMPSGPRPATANDANERRPSSSANSSDGAENARKAALDALNGDSSDSGHIDTPSPPRSIGSKDDGRRVIQGGGMRPLRLLKEDDRKANNRASWVPTAVNNWFNAATAAAGTASTTAAGGPNEAPRPNTSNPTGSS